MIAHGSITLEFQHDEFFRVVAALRMLGNSDGDELSAAFCASAQSRADDFRNEVTVELDADCAVVCCAALQAALVLVPTDEEVAEVERELTGLPREISIQPIDRDFLEASFSAIERSVGKKATIRELSNMAGVQYEPFRRLLKRLVDSGVAMRSGCAVTQFDGSAARHAFGLLP